jgi:ABC-type Fe3+/spermidine/putrescine transport system ATPase subunit
MSSTPPVRRGSAMMFQDYALFLHLSRAGLLRSPRRRCARSVAIGRARSAPDQCCAGAAGGARGLSRPTGPSTKVRAFSDHLANALGSASSANTPDRGCEELTNAAQSNSSLGFAILKPWDARPPEQSAMRLVADVRSKLLAIPEAFALSFDPPSIPGLGTIGGFEFEVEDLTGRGSFALNVATQALIAEAGKQPYTGAVRGCATASRTPG